MMTLPKDISYECMNQFFKNVEVFGNHYRLNHQICHPYTDKTKAHPNERYHYQEEVAMQGTIHFTLPSMNKFFLDNKEIIQRICNIVWGNDAAT